VCRVSRTHDDLTCAFYQTDPLGIVKDGEEEPCLEFKCIFGGGHRGGAAHLPTWPLPVPGITRSS